MGDSLCNLDVLIAFRLIMSIHVRDMFVCVRQYLVMLCSLSLDLLYMAGDEFRIFFFKYQQIIQCGLFSDNKDHQIDRKTFIYFTNITRLKTHRLPPAFCKSNNAHTQNISDDNKEHIDTLMKAPDNHDLAL